MEELNKFNWNTKNKKEIEELINKLENEEIEIDNEEKESYLNELEEMLKKLNVEIDEELEYADEYHEMYMLGEIYE